MPKVVGTKKKTVGEKMKPSPGPSLFLILGTIGCGAYALILSHYFSLEHLAIIGLGLVSWGLIFLYIRPRELISSENLVMAISSIKAVDKLLVDSGYLGKGIYLPPQYLRGSKECQVFVPRSDTFFITSTEKLPKNSILSQNNGISIVALGNRLASFCEKKLGIDFSNIDVGLLELLLSRLLTELRVVESLTINEEEGKLHIKITGFTLTDSCLEVQRTTHVCGRIGCFLCSALACLLAKATGKPLIIEKDFLSKDTRELAITLSALEVER